MKILLINPPNDYYVLLGTNIRDQLCRENAIPDLVHMFIKTEKEFESKMKRLERIRKINPNIIIWVSWYKKSSGIPTDVNEDTIRNYALKNDLVDIKVCAVSEVWSGLKLVVPLAKRKASELSEKRK